MFLCNFYYVFGTFIVRCPIFDLSYCMILYDNCLTIRLLLTDLFVQDFYYVVKIFLF